MWPSGRFIQFGLALIAGHGPGVFWILSAGSEIMAMDKEILKQLLRAAVLRILARNRRNLIWHIFELRNKNGDRLQKPIRTTDSR